jgi:hypothetical protein
VCEIGSTWFKLQQLLQLRWARSRLALLVRIPPDLFIALVFLLLEAYAVYFDHRRRTDPNFRKQLKKDSKRLARAAKEEAEANTIKQRQAIRAAVQEAKEEGFPVDVEEKEAYFMQEVARGEGLSTEGS